MNFSTHYPKKKKVSSLKYFEHIQFEAKVLEEDHTHYVLASTDHKDSKKYLLKKNSKTVVLPNQKVFISAVPILSEKGVELFDVKISLRSL